MTDVFTMNHMIRTGRRPVSRWCILLFTLWATVGAHVADSELPRYETKYYILCTDVPKEQAQEVGLRMTKMAEEYHARTRDFAGDIRTKLPFFLYQHSADYIAAGGMEGTAGLFDGHALYAVAGERLNDRTWHVVQHEGFHQFAAAVIGGARPMWIDEGLAEYFGEALFTGDGFVSGIVPQWRLKRLREEITGDKLLSVERMMDLSRDEWNGKIAIANYDQAWSMVHFLAHGENGKYRAALAAMMLDLSRGKEPEVAFADNFGSAAGFEQRWKQYWLKLPDDPTADLYVQATVARLTSYLARATAQKQTFSNYQDFRTAAISKMLKISVSDWLPDDLLLTAVADADDMIKAGDDFVLTTKPSPQIQCQLKNGQRCVGIFSLQHGQVLRVDARLTGRR
jgi:uncharacterized protein DUF1570